MKTFLILLMALFTEGLFAQGTLYKGSFTGNGGVGPAVGQTGLTNVQISGLQPGTAGQIPYYVSNGVPVKTNQISVTLIGNGAGLTNLNVQSIPSISQFNVTNIGVPGLANLACDGVTDDSFALNALLRFLAITNGGGAAVFPASVAKIKNPLIYPNGGSSSNYFSYPVTFIGTGCATKAVGGPVGGSWLDFESTNTGMSYMFQELGWGQFSSWNMNYEANQSVSTTNANPIFFFGNQAYIHNAQMFGSPNGSNFVDWITLGSTNNGGPGTNTFGTNQVTINGTTNEPFQGYMSEFDNISFWKTKSEFIFGTYVAGVLIRNCDDAGGNLGKYTVIANSANTNQAGQAIGQVTFLNCSFQPYTNYVFYLNNVSGFNAMGCQFSDFAIGGTVVDGITIGGGFIANAYVDEVIYPSPGPGAATNTCSDINFIGDMNVPNTHAVYVDGPSAPNCVVLNAGAPVQLGDITNFTRINTLLDIGYGNNQAIKFDVAGGLFMELQANGARVSEFGTLGQTDFEFQTPVVFDSTSVSNALNVPYPCKANISEIVNSTTWDAGFTIGHGPLTNGPDIYWQAQNGYIYQQVNGNQLDFFGGTNALANAQFQLPVSDTSNFFLGGLLISSNGTALGCLGQWQGGDMMLQFGSTNLARNSGNSISETGGSFNGWLINGINSLQFTIGGNGAVNGYNICEKMYNSGGMEIASFQEQNQNADPGINVFASRFATNQFTGLVVATNGFASYATNYGGTNGNINYTQTSTVVSNASGGNLQVSLTGTAITYVIFNNAGNAVCTNTSLTGTIMPVLQPNGKVTNSAGTVTVNGAWGL